jgi:hypothetical protein
MTWLDPMEPNDDALAQLLTTWRAELDDHTGTAMSTELPVVPSRSRRWVRAHQRTAAATAIVVVLAGSTSVAAAASGTTGPLGGLHKFLYGPPAAVARIDAAAARADHLLDNVAAHIDETKTAGSISTSRRSHLSSKLDSVQHLLDGDTEAPAHLQARLNGLRAALAAIPAPAPPPATAAHHRGHGSDDTPGDDRTRRSGEGRQGGDDAQDEDRSGDSSSDDNSTGDQDDRSGSQGGDDNTSGGDRQGDEGSGDNSGSDDGGSSSDSR